MCVLIPDRATCRLSKMREMRQTAKKSQDNMLLDSLKIIDELDME